MNIEMNHNFPDPAKNDTLLTTSIDDVENDVLSINPEQAQKLEYSIYPQIQQSVDRLKAIAGEIETAKGVKVEHTKNGEPIFTNETINTWMAELKIGDNTRGTHHNADMFVYFKGCNLVEKDEDIDQVLKIARDMTAMGAIHPESQWVVNEDQQGWHRLVVISPKLEAWSLNKSLAGEYDNRFPLPMKDESHLTKWFQRIDPNYVEGQPIPNDSLLHHLNPYEASHPDNWGWDETGTLFPVDVEVLHPGPYVIFGEVDPDIDWAL